MKLQWVAEARQWYKLFSLWGLGVIGTIQGVMAVMTEPMLLSHIPGTQVSWLLFGQILTLAATAITALGRLLKQVAVELGLPQTGPGDLPDPPSPP